MELCKTSYFSIFTFIDASDLKFCIRSYSSCVYRMMRFKGSNGNVCKTITSHVRTLLVLSLVFLYLLTQNTDIWPTAQIVMSLDKF